jgi:hypothetical protein
VHRSLEGPSDVLDGEWLGISHSFLVVGLLAPHALTSAFIPDEDCLAAPIIKLLQAWVLVLDMGDTSECVEEVHRRCLTVLSLEWSLALHGAYR